LQTEDGTPAGLKLATFGLLSRYTDVHDALVALGNEAHDFQTVVLDSLDKMEGLIWTEVCETNKWPSIEAPGNGKGYVLPIAGGAISWRRSTGCAATTA
jgi:hypothetical protein